MTKAEFVSAVAEKTGATKKDSEACLDAVLEVITESLKAGKEVQFIGFGAFKVTEKPAREGRHPATGAPIKIAASKAISFKVGSKLKEAVNPAAAPAKKK